MPEGHTIHRAARLQNELLTGDVVAADSPQGRFAEGAALLDGRVLRAVTAYGKHLFYDFDEGVWLHVHLGLFGKFRYGASAPPLRPTTRLRMSGTRGWVHLSGPTACEIIDIAMRRAILARIGPDPLRADARPAAALARIARSAVAIGALLMDQSVIGGIGNVYRAELLFRARLDPHTPGKDVPEETVRELWRDWTKLLKIGVKTGQMLTMDGLSPAKQRAAMANRADRHWVYHRTGEPCRVCGTPIVMEIAAGRKLYYCPMDQR